jgi:AcrR family transcriptional regulator
MEQTNPFMRWAMRELKSIEERILDRAQYLMGINKTCDISIRAIAKEANVNVSAINYYFRTKEEMVRMVKEFYMANTRTVFAILEQEEYDPEERLVLAANEIMEYSLRFPGNMVILRDSMRLAEEDETSRRIVAMSQELGEQLSKLLQALIPGVEAEQNRKYMIFMSAVNYPTEDESSVIFKETLLDEKEERLTYLRLLVKVLRST